MGYAGECTTSTWKEIHVQLLEIVLLMLKLFIILFKFVFLLIFLSSCSSAERGVNVSTTIMEFFLYPFNSVQLCFIYFQVLSISTYLWLFHNLFVIYDLIASWLLFYCYDMSANTFWCWNLFYQINPLQSFYAYCLCGIFLWVHFISP